MHPFRIEALMNLLFLMIWETNRLDTRLKNNFPSTFIKDIGRKSLIELGLGGLFLGM